MVLFIEIFSYSDASPHTKNLIQFYTMKKASFYEAESSHRSSVKKLNIHVAPLYPAAILAFAYYTKAILFS